METNIKQFVKLVCEELGLDFDVLFGRSRKCPLTQIRNLVCLCLYDHRFNDREIGEIFGRERSTITHARKAAQDLIDTERKFRNYYKKIEDIFEDLQNC